MRRFVNFDPGCITQRKEVTQFQNSYFELRILLVDCLISIGDLVSSKDHIDIILEGLSEDCDLFITIIHGGTDPISVTDIDALLLAQKA